MSKNCTICNKNDKEINENLLCEICIRKFRITNFTSKYLNILSEAVINIRTTYSCPQCCINKRFIHFCDHHDYCMQCHQFVCSESCGTTIDNDFFCHNCIEDNKIQELGGEESILRCELCLRNIDDRLVDDKSSSTQCKFCKKKICSLCLIKNNEVQDACFCCYQDFLEEQVKKQNIFKKIYKFIFPDFKA
ncbi:MAG: hypothetical protein COB02_07340 [Candidatus Cloacimonadota bacterium]|nr:MAG: hypothetical protein COB02_07340 [Candidatus Cloacimonadota bacterium]